MATKKQSKIRNPFVIPSKERKSGTHKSKKSKRQNGENKQKKYLEDDF